MLLGQHFAKNCEQATAYTSQGTPARGIGPPPAWLGKLLNNIA